MLDGQIGTTSTTQLTIPDYPIGNQLLAVSLTVGTSLNIQGGDIISIADPTGLNTMTGYVTSYASATGALVCQIGCSFEFEIRREGPRGGYGRDGYSVFYDIGAYPSWGPIITAQLGNGLQMAGVGVVQILIPAVTMSQLHLGTYLASMTVTDSINTRQIFIAQLPIQYGGVTRPTAPNPGLAAWQAEF